MTPGPGPRLRDLIADAEAVLSGAGVDSARADAELLAAHAAGTDRSRLAVLALTGDPIDDDVAARLRDLVTARARRIPLQHLTGTAAFGPVTVAVGPGVFTPRPETEALLDWASRQLTRGLTGDAPLIVDACTGSGALALALAHDHPGAQIIAIDDSPEALGYTRRNTAGTAIRVVEGDVTDPGLLAELDGRVDLVVCNPPYIPDGAELDPEVVDHDPHHALFGGPDGMSVIPAVAAAAARWLCPGGAVGIEHDDTTSAQTREALARTEAFDDILARADLTGRPRFVTAIRRSAEKMRHP